MTTNFFINQLEKLPPDRGLTFNSKGAWIRCPNPNHSRGMENTPSLLINVEGKRQGQLFCFGCKEIKGSWNNLVKYYPKLLTPLSENAIKASIGFSFKNLASDDEDEIDVSKLIPWPATKDWRGIRGDTLVRFNTKVVEEKMKYGERKRIMLVFPVMNNEKTVGYIRATLEKPKPINGKKPPTYLNMAGAWSKKSLFGYDQAKQKMRKLRKLGKPTVLWVVEGPRDTMNIEQHGGAAVGLIGSYMTPQKSSMITALDPDVIIIATDNDDAGNLAAENVREQFAELIPCIRLLFKGDRDPADLSKEQVKRYIKRAIRRR